MRVLVTGGSSDIGQAIARRRLEKGDSVIVTASSQETLKGALEKLPGTTGFVFDLKAPEKSAEALSHLEIDAVVFNAASRLPKLRLFHDMKAEEFNQFFVENTLGNVWLLRAVLPQMRERAFGRFVFISSLVANNGSSRYSAYCAAKGAMESLFLNIAVDYGSENVLASILRPGIIATERNRRFWQRTGYIDKISSIIPQGKIGAPEQIAEALDPLLSATSYMNGSIIEVSGGFPKFRSQGI